MYLHAQQIYTSIHPIQSVCMRTHTLPVLILAHPLNYRLLHQYHVTMRLPAWTTFFRAFPPIGTVVTESRLLNGISCYHSKMCDLLEGMVDLAPAIVAQGQQSTGLSMFPLCRLSCPRQKAQWRSLNFMQAQHFVLLAKSSKPSS